MSTPISFSSKPPSLLGNSFVPSKPKEEEHPKQRRGRGKKKKSKQKSQVGGDTEPEISYGPDLIDSPPPSYQLTKSREFRFSEDPSETAEARSVGFPGSLHDFDFSKVSNYPQSGDSVSFGASGSKSSNSDDSNSHTDDECLESVIGRRLFELPCTHGLIASFRTQVKTKVLMQLRAVLDKEPTTELVLEIADSIDLLRLIGVSDPMLDNMGGKARAGAVLYGKGLEVMSKGQDFLRSCFSDISSLK